MLCRGSNCMILLAPSKYYMNILEGYYPIVFIPTLQYCLDLVGMQSLPHTPTLHSDTNI